MALARGTCPPKNQKGNFYIRRETPAGRDFSVRGDSHPADRKLQTQSTITTSIDRSYLRHLLNGRLNPFRNQQHTFLNVTLVDLVHLHPAWMHGNQLFLILKINNGVLDLIFQHLEQNLRLIILRLPHHQEQQPFGAAQDAQEKIWPPVTS